MNEYVVMFVEQSICCNGKELKVNDGDRRFMYTVKAKDVDEAFYKGVELAREETKNLVRLNFCKLKEDIGK